MRKKRQLSIKQLKKLRTRARPRRLSRHESGRLAAARLNLKPLRMTPGRVDARRKGGIARGKQRHDESEGLRLKQWESILAARDRLRRKLGKKPTYAQIAKQTG